MAIITIILVIARIATVGTYFRYREKATEGREGGRATEKALWRDRGRDGRKETD
jgi:hypothetical protein